jgi:hypothetical protein
MKVTPREDACVRILDDGGGISFENWNIDHEHNPDPTRPEYAVVEFRPIPMLMVCVDAALGLLHRRVRSHKQRSRPLKQRLHKLMQRTISDLAIWDTPKGMRWRATGRT